MKKNLFNNESEKCKFIHIIFNKELVRQLPIDARFTRI